MAIKHGVLSEKGNGKDQAKSIPKPIRKLLMKVDPQMALFGHSFLAGFKPGGGKLHGPAKASFAQRRLLLPLCFGGEYY